MESRLEKIISIGINSMSLAVWFNRNRKKIRPKPKTEYKTVNIRYNGDKWNIQGKLRFVDVMDFSCLTDTICSLFHMAAGTCFKV